MSDVKADHYADWDCCDLPYEAHLRPEIRSYAATNITLDDLKIQRAWSEANFGPGARTKGVVDHIRKELLEIEADDTDLEEWIDVLILGLDGAWRTAVATGRPLADVFTTLHAKWEKNRKRQWPDWRTAEPDKAITHVKGIHD